MSSLAHLSPPPRHLCDVAFRAGPPEPLRVRPAVPHSADVWSLDAVLRALANGAGVFETRSGLRLRHAHLRPGLSKSLPIFENEVRAWIDLGMTHRPVETALRDWPHPVRLYLAWLDAVLLPSGVDIQLRPSERVVSREAFRASIQGRLCAGPTSSSASLLISDLAALFDRYAARFRCHDAPARHIQRAA